MSVDTYVRWNSILRLVTIFPIIRKLYVPDRMTLTSSCSFYSSKKSKRPKTDNSLQLKDYALLLLKRRNLFYSFITEEIF